MCLPNSTLVKLPEKKKGKKKSAFESRKFERAMGLGTRPAQLLLLLSPVCAVRLGVSQLNDGIWAGSWSKSGESSIHLRFKPSRSPDPTPPKPRAVSTIVPLVPAKNTPSGFRRMRTDASQGYSSGLGDGMMSESNVVSFTTRIISPSVVEQNIVPVSSKSNSSPSPADTAIFIPGPMSHHQHRHPVETGNNETEPTQSEPLQQEPISPEHAPLRDPKIAQTLIEHATTIKSLTKDIQSLADAHEKLQIESNARASADHDAMGRLQAKVGRLGELLKSSKQHEDAIGTRLAALAGHHAAIARDQEKTRQELRRLLEATRQMQKQEMTLTQVSFDIFILYHEVYTQNSYPHFCLSNNLLQVLELEQERIEKFHMQSGTSTTTQVQNPLQTDPTTLSCTRSKSTKPLLESTAATPSSPCTSSGGVKNPGENKTLDDSFFTELSDFNAKLRALEKSAEKNQVPPSVIQDILDQTQSSTRQQKDKKEDTMLSKLESYGMHHRQHNADNSSKINVNKTLVSNSNGTNLHNTTTPLHKAAHVVYESHYPGFSFPGDTEAVRSHFVPSDFQPKFRATSLETSPNATTNKKTAWVDASMVPLGSNLTQMTRLDHG